MSNVNIQGQINILADLQKIDAEIFTLERSARNKPGEIRAMEAEFESRKASLNELESGLKRVQIDIKKLEGDLAEKEEGVKKLQGQLYKLKTNKEYTTMQGEIESAKADKSVLEEDLINMLDESDNLNARIGSEKNVLAEERVRVDAGIGVINEEMRKITEDLARLKKERSAFVEKVDKDILAKYERVLQKKDGIAMVPVENNACQGCYMNLPPQVINEIKMKNNLICCESCARILYIKEDHEP